MRTETKAAFALTAGTKLRRVLLAGLAVITLASCASTKIREAPQLEPGRVAIVAAHYAPMPNFNNYAHGRAATAAQGAIGGAGAGAATGAVALLAVSTAFPPLLYFMPYVAAVGGAIGGVGGLIGGAANGMPSDQVKAIHEPIDRALSNSMVQDAMAQRVAALGMGIPHYQITYLPEFGPASAADTPEYHELKAAGYDSVLEIAVASVGFDVVKGVPPSAVFEMKLRARVVPLSAHDSPSFVRELQHRGTWRGVPEWAADDGRLLQQELDESYRALAHDLSQAVFSPASAR